MSKRKNNFVELTTDFERWFRKNLETGRAKVVRSDIRLKHKNMSLSRFLFLRATFYAWIRRFHDELPELCTGTPIVLAVGDVHIENFGTWRDFEGRLCWGMNDFDEAFPLPYTNDLVRLATSAKLAIEENGLHLTTREACEAILEGYIAGLKSGGQAFVLGELNSQLREMAVTRLQTPGAFWQKLDRQVTAVSIKDLAALNVLEHNLPAAKLEYRFGHRTAGQGSLGRPRYVAVASYHGGKIAREVKKHLPSACVWAGVGAGEADRSYYNETIDGSFRSADPFLREVDGWVVRRLSPDCSRIELIDLPRNRDEHLLLAAQGAEIANIHLGTKGRNVGARILKDLGKRNTNWLRKAVKKMAKVTADDQHTWAAHYQRSTQN